MSPSTSHQPTSLQEELHKKHPFEVREQEAYLNLMRTSSMLDGDFERFYRAHGLSIATYNVLRILRGAGERGRMCHEIRDHMVAQVPDITRLVDRLEEAGFATRSRCDVDRRVVYCHITQKGLDLLSQLDEPVKDRHRRQLAHLTPEELEQLNGLLFKARHPPVPIDLCP